MNTPDQFRNNEEQTDKNYDNQYNDNQPALNIPRVDHQRDQGSGLNAGTAPGVNSADSYEYNGELSVGPGSDPHAGVGDGAGLTTGQFRGSDDGTTTGPIPAEGQGSDSSNEK